ncbi:unnamed protein product [Psylliodes chrysocephalus]|uniref:GILT-like protein 1 n=1 Tax=Psylliodes chrysocephalus TaxID=3402493 RepID=A0A9P0GFZ3_9CUCU|nr:unnamed protein product [Psylliodes chrysocephala]
MLSNMAKNNCAGISSVLVFITVILSLCGSITSVKVTIYYEGLCYDSIKFIGQQLYPHWTQLSPFVSLELVPYGKAIHNLNGNKYEFFCQHGSAECRSNKLQACLLNQNLGSVKDVSLVYCIMSSRNPGSFDIAVDCANELGYNVKRFKKCALTTEADNLLAQNGDKTSALKPDLQFVPTIVYDDEYSKMHQDQSLIDFVAVVCSKLVQLNAPKVCQNRQLPVIEPVIQF